MWVKWICIHVAFLVREGPSTSIHTSFGRGFTDQCHLLKTKYYTMLVSTSNNGDIWNFFCYTLGPFFVKLFVLRRGYTGDFVGHLLKIIKRAGFWLNGDIHLGEFHLSPAIILMGTLMFPLRKGKSSESVDIGHSKLLEKAGRTNIYWAAICLTATFLKSRVTKYFNLVK